MMHFDERRLTALEKALNNVAPPSEAGYYRINVNSVRELIADLREWQHRATNAERQAQAWKQHCQDAHQSAVLTVEQRQLEAKKAHKPVKDLSDIHTCNDICLANDHKDATPDFYGK